MVTVFNRINCKLKLKLIDCKVADLFVDFADLFVDFADVFVDFVDLCVDFADFRRVRCFA